MRGAALVGKDYPVIRECLPSTAAVLVFALVRGMFSNEPDEGEQHLHAIETVLTLRKAGKLPIEERYDKDGLPRDGISQETARRMRSAAAEVYAYLEAQGIIAEAPRG